jgi:Uma2 family endonuclease
VQVLEVDRILGLEAFLTHPKDRRTVSALKALLAARDDATGQPVAGWAEIPAQVAIAGRMTEDPAMTVSARPVRHSFAEYIELEEASSTKHELFDGQIFAMAGGSPEHAALIASVTFQLSGQTRGGPCRVHASELRIRVEASNLATYPDVSVVCGPWERDSENARTILNPSVIVEVLSPSTEAYDRGEKLLRYQQIPALRAVALVAHDRREVEVWRRADAASSWTRALHGSGEAAPLMDALELDVDALYDDAAEPSDG